ncbi:hypothetical protein [Heyndrickxia sporothermodurans]
MLVLTLAAQPLSHAGAASSQNSVDLNDAYHRSAATTAAVNYKDLIIALPSKDNDFGARSQLFTSSSDASNASDLSQSGKQNTLNVDQNGKESVLRVDQSGAGNHIFTLQGDLAMLVASQHGAHNEIQMLQAGHGNTSTIDQSGSYNYVSGTQTGTGGKAVIAQTGMHQTAVYSQSGAGAVLTVRQH